MHNGNSRTIGNIGCSVTAPCSPTAVTIHSTSLSPDMTGWSMQYRPHAEPWIAGKAKQREERLIMELRSGSTLINCHPNSTLFFSKSFTTIPASTLYYTTSLKGNTSHTQPVVCMVLSHRLRQVRVQYEELDSSATINGLLTIAVCCLAHTFADRGAIWTNCIPS